MLHITFSNGKQHFVVINSSEVTEEMLVKATKDKNEQSKLISVPDPGSKEEVFYKVSEIVDIKIIKDSQFMSILAPIDYCSPEFVAQLEEDVRLGKWYFL